MKSKIRVNGSGRKKFSLTLQTTAERSRVFDAWTDASQVKLWWGPYHFTNPVCEMDLRTGGRILIEMNAPDGAVFPMPGIFHKIIPDSLLVFTIHAFAQHMEDSALEYLNTVRFIGQPFHTLLTLDVEVMKAVPGVDCLLEGIQLGWEQSFEKLEYMLNQLQITKI